MESWQSVSPLPGGGVVCSLTDEQTQRDGAARAHIDYTMPRSTRSIASLRHWVSRVGHPERTAPASTHGSYGQRAMPGRGGQFVRFGIV